MRGDEDFMAFVAARWPALVRGLVVLGCPPGEAAYVATDALSRCRRGWGEVSREGDVDRLVQDELLAARARQRPRLAGEESPSGEDELRELAEEMTVLAPPTLDDVRAHESRRRRRATRRSLVVLVPVLIVVAGLTWWATRPAEEDPRAGLRPVPSERAENPADVAWYAEGRLHLEHVTLTLPGLRDLAQTGTGAVYGDARGRVVEVGEDGRRTLLGTKDPDIPLVGGADGWVAWVDRREETPRLRVYDAEAGEVVGARALNGPSAGLVRPLAIDDGTVFYTDPDGTRAFLPAEDEPRTDVVEPARLLDASSRARAYQLGADVIRVEQPFSGVAFDLAGTGAEISDDGGYTLTRAGVAQNGVQPVAIYRTRSGKELPSGIDDRFEVALAARLGPDGRVTYVVGKAVTETAPGFVRAKPSGQLELRSCDLDAAECRAVATFGEVGPTLLAY
jgi:hypothetical protein